MTLTVLLHAEGGGEASGVETLLPSALERLDEEHLGAAHRLTRRAIGKAREIDTATIGFLSPLRVGRGGRQPRGSDLHDPPTLRRLLAPTRVRPDLAIVVVDGDGDPTERRKALEKAASVVPVVRGVAVQEFESWMISDHPTAQRVLGGAFDLPPKPENMAPREAKELLARWLGGRSPSEAAESRRALADNLDLDVVAKHNKSFGRFLRDLRADPSAA